MKKHSKKLLSVLLASSMALSMNAAVFAAQVAGGVEEATVADSEAVVANGEEAFILMDEAAPAAYGVSPESSASDRYVAEETVKGEADAAPAAAFVGEETVKGEADAAPAAAFAREETVTLTDSKRIAKSDPISWNVIEDEELFIPLFQYTLNGTTSEHISNGKQFDVSANGGVNGETQLIFSNYSGKKFSSGVSSNVFTVPNEAGQDEGVRLVIIYRLADHEERDYRNITFNPIKGTESDVGVPYVYYDGRKVGIKESAKERDSIQVAASLVKYDSSAGVTVLANSMSMNRPGSKGKSMIKVTPKGKNNQYATVSHDFAIDQNGHASFVDIRGENKNIKKPDLESFFIVNVRINDNVNRDLKEFKSLVKKAIAPDGTIIKKFPFKFQIARSRFARMYDYASMERYENDDVHKGGYNHYDSYGENYLELQSEKTLIKQRGVGNADIKVMLVGEYRILPGKVCNYDKLLIRYNPDAIGFNDESYKYSNYLSKIGKAGQTGASLLKKGDYTTKVITDPSGKSLGILVLTPCGNYEGDSATFRTVKFKNRYGEEVKETRKGVYKDDSNYYVMDVD
ncbi:MAG: hypothetical protein K5989_01715 [Lachnospiraceae bacterium]|nr:hypothetical protein [Lachnospiraceae bacterium]